MRLAFWRFVVWVVGDDATTKAPRLWRVRVWAMEHRWNAAEHLPYDERRRLYDYIPF